MVSTTIRQLLRPYEHDLMSGVEVAKQLNVSPSAVTVWARRHFDFPKPVVTTSGGRIYYFPDVKEWHRIHRSRFERARRWREAAEG